MRKHIFRFSILLLTATAGLVIITPILSFNDLLYPPRIDSAYVSQQLLMQVKDRKRERAAFIHSPRQLNMAYMDISYTLRDSVVLRGWLVLDTLRVQSPLLLIIPDISEGAINYLPAMKQFNDRGFNVCVMDMRGQGKSGGTFYTMGLLSARDVRQLIGDLKKMPFIDRVAVLGCGTGAAIAMKALSDSSLADVLILQNPPVSLGRFFHDKAREEWGDIILPLLPALIRNYENQTGLSVENYDYRRMINRINLPIMLVTANFMKKKVMDETIEVYHASNWFKKRLYIDAPSYMKPTGTPNEKAYYDKLAAFINTSLPPKKTKTRFRKLADT